MESKFIQLGTNYFTREENISTFEYHIVKQGYCIVVHGWKDGKEVPIWSATVEKEEDAQALLSSIRVQF